MASDRGVPGAAIAAILTYKAAALRILSGETGRVAAQYYTFMWNCLGLALKRAGEFDMAERAYLWGMMKITPTPITSSTCNSSQSMA